MQTSTDPMSDPDEDFQKVHWEVIDVLRDGRATPGLIADRVNVTSQRVNQILRELQVGGYVEKIHRGLYELVDDPREE